MGGERISAQKPRRTQQELITQAVAGDPDAPANAKGGPTAARGRSGSRS